jgi:predicted nucleotidyltransferase
VASSRLLFIRYILAIFVVPTAKSTTIYSSPHIYTFEYHINKVAHREVYANKLAVAQKLICFPRNTLGFEQQRKQHTGISGTSIRTYMSQRLLILINF